MSMCRHDCWCIVPTSRMDEAKIADYAFTHSLTDVTTVCLSVANKGEDCHYSAACVHSEKAACRQAAGHTHDTDVV